MPVCLVEQLSSDLNLRERQKRDKDRKERERQKRERKTEKRERQQLTITHQNKIFFQYLQLSTPTNQLKTADLCVSM